MSYTKEDNGTKGHNALRTMEFSISKKVCRTEEEPMMKFLAP